MAGCPSVDVIQSTAVYKTQCDLSRACHDGYKEVVTELCAC